jgi:G:T-mismatch repair DNA endonuclease (very short patch repair protein)
MKGRKHTEESKEKVRQANKGKIRSEETKRKMSLAHIGNKSHLGYRASKETRNKHSRIMKKKWSNPEYKSNHSEIMKKKWSNPKYKERTIKAQLAGRETSPNKSEKKLRRILNKLFPGEYKFVGDGKTIIGGKCPDFININGQKKLIELFGDFWHGKKYRRLTFNDNTTNKIHRQQRQSHFKQYGFRTCVIWERELKNRKKLKTKLRKFNKKAMGR